MMLDWIIGGMLAVIVVLATAAYAILGRKRENSFVRMTTDFEAYIDADLPGTIFVRLDDFKFGFAGRTYRMESPNSVRMDYTTTPAPLQWFLSKVGVHDLAWVIHDALYSYNKGLSNLEIKYFTATQVTKAYFTRREADRIFFYAFACQARYQLAGYAHGATNALAHKQRFKWATLTALRWYRMCQWWVQRHVAYAILRLFGGSFWNK